MTSVAQLEANEHKAMQSREGFAELVRAVHGRLYYTAYSITRDADTAQDLVQETLLRAWLKRDVMDQPGALVQPWLYRIVTNLAIQWVRTGQRRSRLLSLIPLEDMTVEPGDDSTPDPRARASQAEQNNQLVQGVMQLPQELRLVLLQHYAEGMMPSEIARFQGEAVSTVTRRLEKARGHLREYLEGGLAAGLAQLGPDRGAVARAIAVVGAAAALPAASQAQLLAAVADTVLPSALSAVPASSTLGAPAAAAIKGTGVLAMASQLTATKLVVASVVAVSVAGGVYSLKRPGRIETGDAPRAKTEVVALPTVRGIKAADGKSAPALTERERASTGTADQEERRQRRLELREELVATLEKDAVTTYPELVYADGETTGRIYFNIEVVNEVGHPVENAMVAPRFLRLKGNTQGSWGFRSDPESFYTNANGVARLYVPEILSENRGPGAIAFGVAHADYAAASFEMKLDEITKVVLRQGNRLEIEPIDSVTSQVIKSGVTVEFFDYWKDLEKPDWEQRANGRISVWKIPRQDELKFVLKTEGAGKPAMLSQVQQVQVSAKDEKRLQVVLSPTGTVRGRLSSNVPRPVINGTVEAAGTGEFAKCGTYAKRSVKVAEDGTFELNDMPYGEILVWGLTDGWASVNTAAEREILGRPQSFYFDADHAEYELPMNPTATARFTVVDPQGRPVEGVRIGASPNMCLQDCCGMWIRRDWGTKSDENGVAAIENMPLFKNPRFSIWGNAAWEYEPEVDQQTNGVSREVRFDLTPGEITEKTITVHPKGTFELIEKDGKMSVVRKGESPE